MTKQEYFYGLGRRKEATARARLFSGKGKVTINDKPAAEYFNNSEAWLYELFAPLRVMGKEDSYDITIVVRGGGMSGQVDACKLAVSKAIAAMNDDVRSTLKKAGLLKRDSRVIERKKYGLRGARKREQFSKR